MSTPSITLPSEMWSHIASFSEKEMHIPISETCKNANIALTELPIKILKKLNEYPKEDWGGKRLHYLLKETAKFSPLRRLTVIFNEVRRCGQFNNCHTFDDIENAINDAGQRQAEALVQVFDRVTEQCSWAKEFLIMNRISTLKPDNIEHINMISQWIEDNTDFIGTIKLLSLYQDSPEPLHLPHELRFFKNLTLIYGTQRKYTCIPTEVQKLPHLSFSIRGDIDPIAEKDYAPHLYKQKLEKLNLEFFFDPLLECFHPYDGFIIKIFGVILSPIILLVCIVRYLIVLTAVKWNQPPKTVLPF